MTSSSASPVHGSGGASLARPLALAMALCLLMRLGFLLLVRPWDPSVEANAILRDDAMTYHRLAVALLEHGRYAESAEGSAHTFRTPLYPAFMAGVYALAGPRPWAVLVAQAALEVGTVALLFLALTRLFPPRAAVIAVFLYALDPFLTLYTALPLTDAPFVFLLTAVLALLSPDLEASGRPRAAVRAALAGLGLGLATLIRPPSQFLPALIAPYLLWQHRARPAQAVTIAVLFVIAFTAVLAPWIGRNWGLFGRPFLSTAASYQLLVLNAGPLVAEQRGVPPLQAVAELFSEADAEMNAAGHDPAALTDIERAPFYSRVARRHIVADLAGFARVYARGVINGLINVNTSGFSLLLGQTTTSLEMQTYKDPMALMRAFFRNKEAFATRLALVLGPLLVLGYLVTLIGIIRRLRERPRGPALLLLAIGAYFIAIGGALSGVRYRLPAEPFLIGFTGMGILFLIERLRRRANGNR
ncbi:MAG TPA: glycosyltransferase family 39 protein [Candidatus Limnocylindria bacterium]|nr:glycosyltransferase family 39 protein [Candidatus Limnocylindria bacterium]